MARPLPSPQDAALILAAKRTRPTPRPPLAAGRALSKTIKALDDKFGKGVGGLGARWTEIVGAALARRTEPVKLVKSRAGGGAALELRVDGPSATLIQHQAPDILARVNLFLGAEAVTRLRIVQGPLSGFAGRQPPAARPSRRRATGPLDAAAEADLAQSLAALPEGRLKRALTRLGREVLRD
ncbi:MAG: DciA family protein [Pseudomonadota bacterium]